MEILPKMDEKEYRTLTKANITTITKEELNLIMSSYRSIIVDNNKLKETVELQTKELANLHKWIRVNIDEREDALNIMLKTSPINTLTEIQ